MRISDWSSDVCSSDLRPVEDGLAFPVPLRPHVVVRLEERRVLAEQFIDLGLGPDVELAFLAFAVGVEGSGERSEEHTSELQSLMRISYAVFCLKKKKQNKIRMT